MTDPGDLDVVTLEGAAGDLLAAITRLEGYDFALVGGLAVMVRLGGAHRVTNDLDGVFDNPDEDTAATLVTAGVAQASGDSGIVIDGTKLDVIDTQPLPLVVEEVVSDPGGRLFVCAHRYAYEAATPLVVASAGATATIRVATPAALIACKAHALRFGRPQRRATKRPGDLFDLYRLALDHHDDVLGGLSAAPWELRSQVASALHEDLADLEQAAATLRSSPAAELAAVGSDDVVDVLGDFMTALAHDAS
jgi:hypothetical protein